MNSITFGIGPHSPSTIRSSEGLDSHEQITPEERKYLRNRNIMMVLGWIPGIGCVVGLTRIVKAILEKRNDDIGGGLGKQFVPHDIARGIVETLSLGFLCAIPDIIAFIARFCTCCVKSDLNEMQNIGGDNRMGGPYPAPMYPM